MDYQLTEEQELLLSSLRDVIQSVATDRYLSECDENHREPTELLNALAENGFFMLGIPEEYGGTPCDTLTLMLVVEELSKNGCPNYSLLNPIQIDDILSFGNDEQKKLVLDLTQQGKPAFSLGFSEPQAGSDSTAITTTATRKNGKVYINGQKTFITRAKTAPYILLLTRDLDNPKPHQAVSMWLVPNTAPGIKINPLKKMGWWMVETCEIFFDNVEIEESALVGVEGNGFLQLMKNFEVERLLMAAQSLGLAEAAYDDAIRYANQRVQFGKPIGRNQLIQEKIFRMHVTIESMRNMLYKACWEKDNNISIQISSAVTKHTCAQGACSVIDDALQIMGGIGYTADHRISRFYRDIRVARIGGGTDEIMIYIAAKALMKKYQ